ncbi:MAG: DNA gyrase subunit A [Planctomycetota bacterium]
MAESPPKNPQDPDDLTPEDGGVAGPGGPVLGGRVQDLAIERELAESYLTYAMSTIVDRALPDVRDGLKPSQRRVLVAMNDLNLRPGSKHRKCAKIAGDTSGNYHPHGEAVIYPTLVNMAQSWKMRHTLIDPQGNFGSIDPDPPAAMRYTEARMAAPAADMLEDLKLDTVEWQENYDGTTEEPRYLPGKFPNLLVNGGTGIAVGMATSLAPHNLGEVCDAITACIEKPEIELPELLTLIPGPDFPTGGTIMGRSGIVSAYQTGRGRVTVRAKIHHETGGAGGKQDRLVVTEIPYQVSKVAGVIDKIVAMNKAGRLEDVSDIIDESSNRGGMRVVIKLKRGASPEAVENQLYAMTPLQSTFSIINIALVKGQPRTLGLREMIDCYVDHRTDVVRRKTAFLLNKAQQEAHRIEGLIYAVCDIDEVIRLIRASQTRDEAIEKLMARGFRIPADHPYAAQIPQRLLDAAAASEGGAVRLTRVQAESIGRLQLIQLVGLEIEKLVADYAKLVAEIEEYEAILADPKRVEAIILEQVAELRAKYADDRRTVIEEGEASDLDMAALTPVEQVVVTITHSGYVKRLPSAEYKTQGRGGKGVIGSKSKDDDFTEEVFVASTHDDLLCFTDTGRVFKLKVFNIPEAGRTSRGRAIVNMIKLQPGERVVEFMPIADFEKGEDFLLFATANGLVKRTALADYRNVHSGGLNAVNLRDGDALVGVKWVGEDDHLILGTATGMAIRFRADDARAMGRNASGVKGINLAEEDRVVGMVRVAPEHDAADLLTVTEHGYGKRTPLVEYLVQSEDGSTRPQSRGGKGRRDIQTTQRNGRVVAIRRITPDADLMLITGNGMIVRISAESVRQTGRATAGVRVINVADDDRLVGVARVKDEVAEKPDAAIEGSSADSESPGADSDASGPGDAAETDQGGED